MKLPPVNCPNCNSLQGFSPTKRLDAGNITTFITCSMCKTETVISVTTSTEQVAKKRLIRQRNS